MHEAQQVQCLGTTIILGACENISISFKIKRKHKSLEPKKLVVKVKLSKDYGSHFASLFTLNEIFFFCFKNKCLFLKHFVLKALLPEDHNQIKENSINQKYVPTFARCYREHETVKKAKEQWSAWKSCLPWSLSFQVSAAPDTVCLTASEDLCWLGCS